LAGGAAPLLGWGFLDNQLEIVELNTVNALQELHCACASASVKLNFKAAVLKMA